jgi:hypothetical protein
VKVPAGQERIKPKDNILAISVCNFVGSDDGVLVFWHKNRLTNINIANIIDVSGKGVE